MKFIGAIRGLVYDRKIQHLATTYSASPGSAERLALQLALWNKEWLRAREVVPYYRHLSQELHLPRQFASWQEFVEKMPITTRALMQQHMHGMASEGKSPDFSRMTGGSTAEPIQLPAWNSEREYTRYNMWMARRWYGIVPGSRAFAIWGHAHLLGRGITGRFNALKRNLNDWLLDFYRFSAYDLRPEVMRQAAKELIRFKPEYLIGYSVALDLFARANLNLRGDFRKVGLKAVIGAAEGFPFPDSVPMLEDLFGCRVIMEYGSVETDLMAHTHPDEGYLVFWRSYFMEAQRDNKTSNHKVYITSLYPRCVPLVRYHIGDEIELKNDGSDHEVGLDRFVRVMGRCNDYVTLQDGSLVHSELFTHAVRPCQKIMAFQVIVEGEVITINYISKISLSEEDFQGIKWRLQKINPLLADVMVNRVNQLEQTVAGKTRMIIIRN